MKHPYFQTKNLRKMFKEEKKKPEVTLRVTLWHMVPWIQGAHVHRAAPCLALVSLSAYLALPSMNCSHLGGRLLPVRRELLEARSPICLVYCCFPRV